MKYEDNKIKKLEEQIIAYQKHSKVLYECIAKANESVDLLDSIIQQVYDSSEYGMMETDIQKSIEFWQEKELKVIPPPPLASLVKFG